MNRATWKKPYVAFFLLKKKNLRKNFKVWSRNSTIPSFLINKVVNIHTGKIFRRIFVTRDMIGFKFGEFVYTRTLKSKIKKKKKKK